MTLDPSRKFFVLPDNAAVSQGLLDRRASRKSRQSIWFPENAAFFVGNHRDHSALVASPRLDPDESSTLK